MLEMVFGRAGSDRGTGGFSASKVNRLPARPAVSHFSPGGNHGGHLPCDFQHKGAFLPGNPLKNRSYIDIGRMIGLIKFLNLEQAMSNQSSMAIVRQPLVNTVIEALRSKITDKSWKVGERIPTEAELATLFNVGRNTIREAIRVLSHSGMLDVRQGDGTYVRNQIDPSEIMRLVDRSSLQDHFELQCMIESEAAKYAALRRTSADLKKLKTALHNRGEYSPARALAEFLEKDEMFHTAIVIASHNEAMRALYEYFRISVKHNTQQILLLEGLPEPDLNAHQIVYTAIENKDAQLAQDAVKKMLSPMIEYLNKSV
jgi:DNA-binding FadR family transcriptional regulator